MSQAMPGDTGAGVPFEHSTTQCVRKGYDRMSNNSTVAEPRCLSAQRHIVTFRLSKQTYGLPIECITQIIEMVTITPLPQMNDLLEGLITVKGRPVPVISLRRYLGLPRIDWHLHTPIILVQMQERACGLVVDAVIDVMALPSEQVIATDQVFPHGQGDAPSVAGVVRTPEDLILLLDLEQLIGSQGQDLNAGLGMLTPTLETADSRTSSNGEPGTEDHV